MTVSTLNVENDFTPNGSQTVFTFTFQLLAATDIQVYVNSVLINSSNYTVTPNTSMVGGVVTFTVAPAANVGTNKIKRNTARTQGTHLELEAKLDTRALEGILDRLIMISQELEVGVTGPQGPQGEQGPAGENGTIAGPGSSTDNSLVLWDGTGGTTIKDGVAPGDEGDVLKTVGGVWAASAGAATFPSGIVAGWPFDPAVVAVPTGWEPCDGRTVTINGVSRTTIDTRGKYDMGAATDDTGSTGYTGSTVRPGQVAGTKTHQHVNGGSITVDLAGVSGTVTVPNIGITYAPAAGFNPGAAGTYNLAINNHNHTGSLSGNTQASTEATRAICYAELKIIKVDE